MQVDEIKRIGVIGAGLMGHGIAQVFASKGYEVDIHDVDHAALTAAKNRIADNFKVFIELKLATHEQLEGCLHRITLCESIESLCKGSQIIIEAIVEDLRLKCETYRELERFAPPDTIFASNTSAISITEISQALKIKGRLVGTHFWNPPHVLPCVEVVKGDHTDESVFEIVFALMERAGKIPVRVHRDVPGFLGNRLQHAMWREAVSLLENKIASAEDIDKVVKYGFGARMPFIGPLETADLAGLSLTRDIHNYLFGYLESSHVASTLLENLVATGATGVKAGRGFYEWPPEKVRKVIQQRDKVLLRIINEIVATSEQNRSQEPGNEA